MSIKPKYSQLKAKTSTITRILITTLIRQINKSNKLQCELPTTTTTKMQYELGRKGNLNYLRWAETGTAVTVAVAETSVALNLKVFDMGFAKTVAGAPKSGFLKNPHPNSGRVHKVPSFPPLPFRETAAMREKLKQITVVQNGEKLM